MYEFEPQSIKEAFRTLPELLAYQNPERAKIDRIIETTQSNNFDTHYVDQWRSFKAGGDFGGSAEEKTRADEVIAYLEGKLKDQVIIDLGPANSFSPPVKIGKGAYIGVEKFNISEKAPLNPSVSLSDRTYPQIGRIIVVKADMLDFVSRVQNESGNYFISGIDGFIIRSKDYLQELAREIARSTRVGGVVFGVDSAVLSMLDKKQFKEVQFSFGTIQETEFGSVSRDTHIWERVAE